MADKMVPCTNCDGEGFLTDMAGATVPCPVCQGEGEIPESDAVNKPKETGSPGAPHTPPWAAR